MKPYYQDDFCTIYHGDCREVMAGLDEASFTACVTDPPYHLTNRVPDMPMCADCGNRSNSSFQKQGHHRSCPKCGSKNISRVRALGGFMGKAWDGGGIAFDPETWRAVLRALKPGGILLAFGGTRTYHRMACAVEDAGFEVRDCLMWMTGQGFPKSINTALQFEQTLCERKDGKWVYKSDGEEMRSKPPFRDANANTWTGYGSALKPAWEPIILAMKPLDGGYARNALRHGVAGLNVDGGRIGLTASEDAQSLHDRSGGKRGFRKDKYVGGDVGGDVPPGWDCSKGRWPANVLLSHDPRCVRVGERLVGKGVVTLNKDSGRKAISTRAHNPRQPNRTDSVCNYGEETVEVYDCVPGCPVRMLDEQAGVRKSGMMKPGQKRQKTKGGGGYHGNMPDETTACGTYGDEGNVSRFFYCAKASTHERNAGQSKPNRHPTVKPLALITYLLKLVTMPEGTLILDPFMGSGTTLRAAKELGIKAVGIDMEEEYCEGAAERLGQEVLW